METLNISPLRPEHKRKRISSEQVQMAKRKRSSGKRSYSRTYRRKTCNGHPLYDPDARRQMIADQYSAATARGSDRSREAYGHSMMLANGQQRMNRLLTGYKGRGDYRSALGALSRGIGETAGSYFGYGDKGRGLGADFSRWMGWGKYGRKNYKGRGDYGGDAGGNQIMAGSTDVPLMVNASDDLSGDIFLSHREFLGNVTATGGPGNVSVYSDLQYEINPGLSTTFPWLSQIAQNFTLYELQGCIFQYKPTSGEFGGTGTNALGKVVMATQYDPDAAPFTSTIQMENYDYATACKPSESMLHGVETANAQRATNMLYVRSGISTKDRVFTDIGNFQIATEGLPITNGTTANIGELWVSYKVKLSRAQLFGTLLNNSTKSDYFIGTTSASPINNFEFDTTTVGLASTAYAAKYNTSTNTSQFYAAPKLTNTIGCVISNLAAPFVVGGFTITFPKNIVAGSYCITIAHLFGTAVGPLTTFVPTAYSNCTAASGVNTGINLGSASSRNTANIVASANQVYETILYVNVAAPGSLVATVTMAWTVLPAQGHQTSILITEVPSLLLS